MFSAYTEPFEILVQIFAKLPLNYGLTALANVGVALIVIFRVLAMFDKINEQVRFFSCWNLSLKLD